MGSKKKSRKAAPKSRARSAAIRSHPRTARGSVKPATVLIRGVKCGRATRKPL